MFSAAASVSRGGSTDEGSQRGNPSDWSPPVESELPLWYRCTVADDVEIVCFLKRRDVVLLDVRDHVELRFGKSLVGSLNTPCTVTSCENLIKASKRSCFPNKDANIAVYSAFGIRASCAEMALRNLGFTNICNVHSPQKILDVLRKEQEKEEIGSDTMADTLKILTHEQSTLSLKQTRAELPKGNTQEAIWSPPDVLEDYVSTIATQEDILIFLQDGDVTYVDVREPTEFAQKTRVAGSICISCTVTNWEKLETAVFEGRFPEKTEKIAVYCNHGIRSSYAERALRSWGYGNVLNCHNPETILRCLETIKQEEKTRPGAGVVRERKSSAPGTRWVARGVLQKERSRRESIGKDEVWNDSHFVALEWKHLPDFGCTIANDKDIRKFCGQDDIVWLDVRTMTEIDEGPRLPGSLNVHCSCQPGGTDKLARAVDLGLLPKKDQAIGII